MKTTYKICKTCNSINGLDNNYCNKCGHKFGNDDLDREFKLGRIEALSKIKNQILGWFSAIGIIIAILGFFSISNIRDAYKNELAKIQKEKNELEKNYIELQNLSKDLNLLIGFKENQVNLSEMIKFLYVNFYLIKDIYIQAKYTYERDFDINYLMIKPFYNTVDFRKSNEQRNFIEFTTDNILRLNRNQLLVKYKLFQFFEPELISEKISILNDLESIKLRHQIKVKDNYQKNTLLNLFNENQIKNIELNIYVNSSLFWAFDIKYPRKHEHEIIETSNSKHIGFTLQTDYFNFKKEFQSVNEVLNKQFNKVMNQKE